MQEKLEHRKLKINFETNNQFWQCRGASSVYGQERWELTPNPRGWKGLSHCWWPRKPLCQAPTLENRGKGNFAVLQFGAG